MPLSILATLAALAPTSDPASPWTDLGQALPGALGAPQLAAQGDLLAYSAFSLELSNVPAGAPTLLIVGAQSLGLPILGGVLVPSPDLALPLLADAQGSALLAGIWAPGAPAGVPAWAQWWVVDASGPQGVTASNAVLATPPDGPLGGTLAAHWISGGPDCGSEPEIQVHAYNPDFLILRQSLCTSFEAPFLFLIFGQSKVLMIDSGDGGIAISATVQGLIADWLAAHGQASIELVVAHSHSHGDHIAGDSQLDQIPSSTVVSKSQAQVASFFGITDWPNQIVEYDLGGGRVIDVIPIPGHQAAHVAFYDRETAILITGDSLYPGRLYVFGATGQGQWSVYKASMQRLVDFVATRDLCWVLGTHIEMTQTPGVDFELGSTWHPDEHELELTREHLLELNAALQALPSPVIEVHDDFIIYPIG
jgi:glyoxylase-like metal-dependent hydrolase (beta-lactamase superfamily II)